MGALSIENTALLQMSDVGRVPRSPSDTGEPGTMNFGLIEYEPKPNAGEIDKLADYYGVGRRTVECWFAIPNKFTGLGSYRNCVPLAVLGHDARFGKPAAPRERVCSCSTHDQRRIFLAAPLCATGGLTREPIWDRTDRQGNLYIETLRFRHGSLADCVRFIFNLYHGGVVDKRSLSLQIAWVAIRIEANATAAGWVVVVDRTFPDEGESDADDTQCEDAAAGDSTEDD